SLATMLYAVGDSDPKALTEKLRFTLKLSVLVTVPLVIILFLTADIALRIYGTAYVNEALLALRILVFSVGARIVDLHFIAIRRIHKEIRKSIKLVAATGALQIIGAAVGGILWGLPGLCLVYVICVYVEALIMAPTVYKAATGNYRP